MTQDPEQWAVELERVVSDGRSSTRSAITIQAAFAEREARLVGENEKLRDVLSNLSSYLGVGMGDDKTTAEQFDQRIRWGIDFVGNVCLDGAAQVVEECSKNPRTTWGEVKRAILDKKLPLAHRKSEDD